MADNEEMISKPRHGLVKIILEGSADAKKLAAAAIGGTLEKIHLTHPRADGDDADGNKTPGRGPDDGPTDRQDQEIISVPYFG
ncbi:MAG: hypothetical protein ACHQAY_10295 [Hyphomicrobiales bacterium]